jgi:release factor glutamine methyltransferase
VNSTITQLQAEGIRRLTVAGIVPGEARLETRLLLSYASGISREEMHLRPDTPLSLTTIESFQALLVRRERREPLAYILGEREFYGLTFQVTPEVLIPRPETEFLVEAVIQTVKHQLTPNLADIGTGSGVIAISFALQVPQATVFATDISSKALAIAQQNAARHQVTERVTFLDGDLLEPIRAEVPFDAIVSNPPYIAPQEIETLEIEVRDFEPRIALGIYPDALHFYRRLASGSPPLLAPGGILAVEVGQGQAKEVVLLWQEAGFTEVTTVKDYAGIERVVIGSYPGM